MDTLTHKLPRAPCSYLQGLHLAFQPLVLRLQVPDAVLCLPQLGFQLGLQLPAAFLELQELLLGILITGAWRVDSTDSKLNRNGFLKRQRLWITLNSTIFILILETRFLAH